MPSRDKLIRQSSYIFLFLITMGGVLYILFSARIPSELPALTPFRGIALIMIGLLAGWIGAMIGVAGGIIILPLLHFWLGYPTPLAVGTSFIISMFTSASGVFKNHTFFIFRQMLQKNCLPANDIGTARHTH
jgi:LytS/YehU family sensor histidine kinase